MVILLGARAFPIQSRILNGRFSTHEPPRLKKFFSKRPASRREILIGTRQCRRSLFTKAGLEPRDASQSTRQTPFGLVTITHNSRMRDTSNLRGIENQAESRLFRSKWRET